MVSVKNKDGRHQRTVDYQQLNGKCLRSRHSDGYHSVKLDDESRKLTAITPWGRYRNLRFPQGHCSAGGTYKARVQQIISHIPRYVRIVEYMCTFDEAIEDAFSWHAR